MNMHKSVDFGRMIPNEIVVEDPLGHDRPGDARLSVTRRGLCRIASVAAEVGARFEREGIEHDPVAWMMSPRRLFGGLAPLDACDDREHFMRAMLLHGLSIGLDATTADIDDLRDDDELDDCTDIDFPHVEDPEEPVRERLYSATIDMDRGDSCLHGFHASTAQSIDQFRSRVATIFGPEALDSAVCREGINPGVGLVGHLVSADLLDVLVAAQDADAPNRSLAVTAERFMEFDA